jgi:hypothetical protein
VDPEHPVTGVGVVIDVEGTLAGRHDQLVVDDAGSRDSNEGPVAGPGDGAGMERGERETVRPWLGDTSRAEVRRSLEVDYGLPEPVLLRRG